jgi:hypothetical protein
MGPLPEAGTSLSNKTCFAFFDYIINSTANIFTLHIDIMYKNVFKIPEVDSASTNYQTNK